MRGFDDAERDRIRAGLLDAGRELFARHGLQKTTIADLTEPVDVAKSTFYQFFDSKEALYAEVLAEQEEQIAERVLADSLAATDDPEEGIRRFLELIIEEIETNPLVRQLLVGDGLEAVAGLQSDEERRAERERELGMLLPYVGRWHERGLLVDADPRVVANALRAVPMLTLHREDLGEELYDETLDLLARAVADGLTGPSRG